MRLICYMHFGQLIQEMIDGELSLLAVRSGIKVFQRQRMHGLISERFSRSGFLSQLCSRTSTVGPCDT
ncbi:hypothetical protein CapIbe_002507 [Capra ibex]